MRVLHANWTGGALLLWGERAWEADGAAATPPLREEAPMHPFAMSAGEVAECVRALGVRLAGGLDGAFVLALPSVGEAPLPSPSLAHAAGMAMHEPEESARMATWSVPALALEPRAALAALEDLDDSREDDEGGIADLRPGAARRPTLGPSIVFFACAGRLARSLAAQQRFVPMLLQQADGGLSAAWRPWLSDERTAARLSALLASMPPVARAADDAFRHEAWPVLEDFLNETVDALCRAALESERMEEAIEDRAPGADAHVAWLSGLLGRRELVPASPADRPALLRGVREWIGALDDRGADVEWRLCLRLHEPVPSEEGEHRSDPAAWRLSFHLQSVEREQVMLSAEDVWALSADSAAVDGRRVESPKELLLAELGRASRIFRRLETALQETAPTGLALTTRQAYEFLREMRPLLIEQGIGAYAPEWWESPAARLGVRIEIESEEAPEDALSGGGVTDAGDGRLGLAALVDYRWQIAVGDTTMSMREFEDLVARREPLVRIEGRWVEIRPEDIETAAKFLRENPGGRIRVADALRLAYGVDDRVSGVPVVGLRATGWVSSLLSAGEGARFTEVEQPELFIGALRPYQLKGLAWLSFLDSLRLGACLADDMGLGKTIQLLALLQHERERAAKADGDARARPGPTLLVAPTSVVSNWRREAARFAPELRVLVHHGVDRASAESFPEKASESDLVVTTYALAHRDFDRISRVGWERVVLDEAQNIKNPSAKQSQSLRSLPSRKRIALTGTPVENRLSELWSILDFCNPGFLGPAADFRRRFAAPIERRHDPHRTTQLRRLVQPFVLRRLKTDPAITADLPDKLVTKDLCFLTPEQASLYEAAVKGMLAEVDRTEGIQRRGVVLATLIKLKQICNHPLNLSSAPLPTAAEPPSAARSGKAARLLELLDEVIAAGGQALVFTQFRRMGHLLAAMIRHSLDREALFLHGGTPAKSREHMIDRFQKGDGSAPVFVLSLKAGGLGMNLTAANHVFHYDRWWNPAVENQATDRAHRIGQTRTVHVHKFIVAGTLEERIDQMIEQKTELAQNIIASGERWLTELSTEQLRDILTLREDAVAEDFVERLPTS